jgi:outer membrane protein
MKYQTIAAAILALAGLSATTAQAQDAGQWELRVRATHLSPADKSDPVGGTGAADRIHVSTKTIPEFDVSYFFTPNLAAELVLTIPQKHDVTLDGVNIGTFKHLPPTLLGQYHFAPASDISPYVGAGINYTNISGVHLLNGAGGLEHSSVGLALQAGVNFKIDKHWTFNADVKKVQIRSDVTAGGAKVSAVKVDPVLLAIGVGYRF